MLKYWVQTAKRPRFLSNYFLIETATSKQRNSMIPVSGAPESVSGISKEADDKPGKEEERCQMRPSLI